MLKIKNLTAASDTRDLISDINLEVNNNEIHAIMGPKHSGKTALVHSISGHPSIYINDGTITFKRKKLNNIEVEDRYNLGIFTSFQHPPEFNGTTNWDIITNIFTNKTHDVSDLQIKYTTCKALLSLDDDHGERLVNGEHMTMSEAKRNEIILMMMSDPSLIILDEIDQSLEDEDIVLIGSIVREFVQDRACIVVTHSQVLLDVLQPTHVHVMVDGSIKHSGDGLLYKRIVEDGYSKFS
jgi:Fe-S cluster assembly ATP-binding protein